MMGFIRRAAGRMRDLTARHPVLVLTAVGLLGAGGVSAGGYYALRTYDYVQHDNEFCLSCHLMVDPFERFAQSAHRGLGCKACHQPTMVARSQMAISQVIQNPDSLGVHAVVPNEACAACHIEGDPETWESIAQSAGHRVHLESTDPDLQGLMCVECHASGVHEFAATDKTCAQSGCHTDVEIRLGRMGDLTIHCAACHGFSRPIESDVFGDVRSALAPTESECLSCHVMRTLVDMPPDEPHDRVCSTCHNPHTQTLPAQAVETCATVGCHDDVRELTPFHVGLDHTAIENCTQCHIAHDWKLTGDDCLSCHQDVFDDGPAGGRGAAASGTGLPSAAPVPPRQRPSGVGFASLALSPTSYLHAAGAAGTAGASSGTAAGRARTTSATQQPVRPSQVPPNTAGEFVFRHANHRNVECTACHISTQSHGAVTVTDINDCRSCHHTGAPANDCSTCHRQPVLAARGAFPVPLQLSFSVVEGPVNRSLPFGHGAHPNVTCNTCHQSGLQRPVDTSACLTCHTEHHEVGATCMTCHVQPVESAHTVEVHRGCTGTGCHEAPPFEGLRRDNQACLVCHQDLVEHRPGRQCAECHALAGPGPS